MGMILGFAAVGSVLLVILSIYPGLLTDLRFYALISAPFWLPALAVGGFVLLDFRSNVFKLSEPRRFRPSWCLGTVAIVIVTSLLISNRVARRAAFWMSRPAFEQLAASVSPSCTGDGLLDRRLGLFHVRRCLADPRGGVYFQTYVGVGGLFFHRTTHGFVYNPNASGSPFGDAQFHSMHMIGNWYCFQAEEP